MEHIQGLIPLSPYGSSQSSLSRRFAHQSGAGHRWEGQCLADDPFAGDYGGSGDSDDVLSDKMVTNRDGGTCSTCGGPCEPGTRNRVRAEVYDGEFMRFRWCVRCCFGMAVYDVRPSILDARIASAIEAQRATTVQQGVVHESAVAATGGETPEHRLSHHPRDPDNG